MNSPSAENGVVSGAVHGAPALSESQKAEVLRQLDRVLRSHTFRGSKRCQDFLQFIVEHALAGDVERLKGRNIGVEVFGRDPTYDPNMDAIVRVNANELRKRLAQYYVETDHAEELRIDLPLGSYVPDFHQLNPVEMPVREGRRKQLSRPVAIIALLAVAVAVALAVGAALLWPRSATPHLDSFWEPVMASPRPVVICSGHPVVYFLSRRVHDAYKREKGIDPTEGPYVIEFGPTATVEGRDIVPVRGQYVGVGDAVTSNLLHGHFVRMKKPDEVRFGNDISFADFRNSPAVLIGAYSNRWTLQMTNQLRYVFVMADGVKAVEDRLMKNKRWALPDIAPDGKTDEDYAIVSRVFDSQSGALIISAAGITQYGTRAAGEFLTTESLIAAATSQAPADWRTRNMQVVLHTRVVGETPTPPEVVAVHFW